MKVLSILIFLIFYFNFVFSQTPKLRYPDYKKHPCKRTCCHHEPKTCEYNITIDHFFTMMDQCKNCTNGNEKDCDLPDCNPGDGRFKLISTFNGMLPAPTIEVCQYDEIVVNVKNNLGAETTAVHFHGLNQETTPGMDGVPMITQYPILPGSRMTYKFKTNQHGTHFYHSHAGTQLGEGAYGKILIKQAEERNVFRNYTKCKKFTWHYDRDLTEHTIILSDWLQNSPEYHLQNLEKNFYVYNDAFASILLNGYGASNQSVPIRKFKVKKGDSYRFRLINAAIMACGFKFSIEDHQFDVISSDGYDIEPVTVDTLTIQNGERYDIVIRATQDVQMYKMQFVGNSFCKGKCTSAVLEYEGSKEDRTKDILKFYVKKEGKKKELNDVSSYDKSGLYYSNLRAFIYPEKDHPWNETSVTIKKYFVLGANKADVSMDPNYVDERFAMTINNISFARPSSPFLVKEKVPYCNADQLPKHCEKGREVCKCPHLIEVPENALVEFIFLDGFSADKTQTVHSVHFHGHTFWVMGQGALGKDNNLKTLKEMDEKGSLQRNMIKPIVKDTVSVPTGGYTIVRFLAKNPGYWFLHCHSGFHSSLGMSLVVKVGKGIVAPDNRICYD